MGHLLSLGAIHVFRPVLVGRYDAGCAIASATEWSRKDGGVGLRVDRLLAGWGEMSRLRDQAVQGRLGLLREPGLGGAPGEPFE
jgi:hypothetical protein